MSIKYLRLGLRQTIASQTNRLRPYQIKRGLLAFCHIVQQEDPSGYTYMGWKGLSKALRCDGTTAKRIKSSLIKQGFLRKAGSETDPACFLNLIETEKKLLPEARNCQIKYYQEMKGFFPWLRSLGIPHYGFYFLEIAALLCNSHGFVLLKERELADYSGLSLSSIKHIRGWLRKHGLIYNTKELGFKCWRFNLPIVGFGYGLKGEDFKRWLDKCHNIKRRQLLELSSRSLSA